jgi:hypothetical protein
VELNVLFPIAVTIPRRSALAETRHGIPGISPLLSMGKISHQWPPMQQEKQRNWIETVVDRARLKAGTSKASSTATSIMFSITARPARAYPPRFERSHLYNHTCRNRRERSSDTDPSSTSVSDREELDLGNFLERMSSRAKIPTTVVIPQEISRRQLLDKRDRKKKKEISSRSRDQEQEEKAGDHWSGISLQRSPLR